jgi:hypothetical protein
MKNPYPASIFPMTVKEYAEAVPDSKTRSAISGGLGRHFWALCSHEWAEQLLEWMTDEDNIEQDGAWICVKEDVWNEMIGYLHRVKMANAVEMET